VPVFAPLTPHATSPWNVLVEPVETVMVSLPRAPLATAQNSTVAWLFCVPTFLHVHDRVEVSEIVYEAQVFRELWSSERPTMTTLLS
jgi:hypothetical protein